MSALPPRRRVLLWPIRVAAPARGPSAAGAWPRRRSQRGHFAARARALLLAVAYVFACTFGIVGATGALLPAPADAAPAPVAVAATTTSPYGGAAGVTWSIGFTTPSGLHAGAGITVGVHGAVFSSDPHDYTLTVGGQTAAATVTAQGGDTFIIAADSAVAAGAQLGIQALNTVNPAVPAGQTQVQSKLNVDVGGTTAAPVTLTFQATTIPSGSSGGGASAGRLALGAGQLAPLPAEPLPSDASTASTLAPYTLQFDINGDNLNGHTSSYGQTLDTATTTINGQQVISTINGSSYFLRDSAAIEVPVQCTSNAGWLTACNIQVLDANGNAWPGVRVIDRNGSAVTPGGVFGSTTLQQVAVNTGGQPATSPAVNPLSAVPVSPGFGDYISNSAWGPVLAPDGLTLIPMYECSATGGQQTVSATLLIPLNGPSAQIKIETTDVATALNSLENNFGLIGQQFFGGNGSTAPSACEYQSYVAMFELATHAVDWAQVLAIQEFGTLSQASDGSKVFTEYTDARTLNIAQLPAAEVQLNVMPYKILYQTPGDNGHSQFALSQSSTSQTDFSITHENSNTSAVGNQVGWSAGLSAEGIGSVTYSGSWDQTTTQTQSSSSGSGQSEAWTSEVGQQWQSYSSGNSNGLPQLDVPGTQPWLYDEFVLKVHPQFAVYDDWWCPDGGTDCGVSSNGTAQPNPGQGATAWTLLGSRPVEFDVRAGQLLACAEGTSLPIPNTSPVETLTSAECLQILDLDPFAAAHMQSLDPSSTTDRGAIGPLAIPVESFAAGEPSSTGSGGTNGSYTIALSTQQQTTNSTSQTSSFTSSIDSTITNKVDASVEFPIAEGVGGSLGASYQSTISSGQSMTVSYSQSQTASSVTQSAAEAVLSDIMNPIQTNIFLDTRWDTLMFQVPQPQVTSVGPAQGLVTGGAVLQVAGHGFYSGPVAVQFCPGANGTGGACTTASAVDVSEDTALTVTAPALQPGIYCVQVLDTGGDSTCASSNEYTALTPEQEAQGNGVTTPVISTVTPSNGPDGGGTAVTLTGANLAGVQQVWFGSSDPQANPGLFRQFLVTAGPTSLPTVAQAPFVILGNGEIMACAPPVAAPETVWVSVYGSAGWSDVTSADQFAYTSGAGGPCNPSSNQSGPPPAPAVTGVSPAQGPVSGGSVVTVSGTGFAAVPQSVACSVYGCPTGSTATLLLPPRVQFCAPAEALCSQASDVQVIDAHTLQIQVPPSFTGTGPVDVEVMGAGGWSAANPADQFTYMPPSAQSCGPETIQVPVYLTIVIGGVVYRIPDGYKTVTVNVPCPGDGSVALAASPPYVAVGLESAHLSATLLDSANHPVANAPVQFSTTQGQLSVAGAVYTDAGGVAQIALSSTTPGTASVAATVYGKPPLLDRTQVTFEPVPVVTGLSVNSGLSAGGTMVQVVGQGFSGATAVYFGATPARVVSASPDGTSITVTSPPGFGTVDVRVANPAVESGPVAADQFTYAFSTSGGSGYQPQTPPVITGISPAYGPAGGGQTVTVTGTGFTGAEAVYFGQTPGTGLQVVSDGSLTVTAPAGNGTVDVIVQNKAGDSGTVPADRYAYRPLPVVTSVSPANGPLAGGTAVTVGGTGLGAVTEVSFSGVPATDVKVVSDDELTAVAPPGAAAGPVAVTVTATCSGSSAGVTACGTSLADPAGQFAYLPAPVVSGLTPSNGPVSGGETVTITGTGFTTATGVFFGALPAQRFTISSDGQIAAVAPAGAGGSVDVTVTTACGTRTTADATSCGTSTAGSADRFTFGTPPAVTAVAPANGPLAGGTPVTITGTGFTTASAVSFGSVPAASFRVVSDTQIQATTAAAAAAGTVSVTVTAVCGTAATQGATGCGTSTSDGASRFAFLPLPAVQGVSPAHGPVAGGKAVTITGSGFATATAVDFGGVAATQFTVQSDGQITATVPPDPSSAGGAADVTVTTACGTAATAGADSCGTSPLAVADQYLYYPASAQVVTRTLKPGWNTLSIPFPLAQGDLTLDQILGGVGPSTLLAAFGFENGHWRFINRYDREAVAQPMQGYYLLIGGSTDVTASLIPAGTAASGGGPVSPNAPATLALNPGWNLVGPSAVLGAQSYSSFLASAEPGSVPILIDPNGADVPVTQPGNDAADTVQNGHAYWLYVSQPGQSLVGQILTSPAPGGAGDQRGAGR